MQTIKIQPVARGLQGSISIPGDKSISHRSIMLGALAEGKTVITNFLNSGDCLCTAKAFQDMGIEITGLGTDTVVVSGNGLHGLQEPSGILDMGNSGTSTRLMSGILAGQVVLLGYVRRPIPLQPSYEPDYQTFNRDGGKTLCPRQ